jgi:hypothetical protein
MLYAKLDQELWPLQWEELEYLTKRLKQLDWAYAVEAEKSIFGSLPTYRFVLIKWSPRMTINAQPKREELGTFKSVEEITPILKLLISTEEDKLKEMGVG